MDHVLTVKLDRQAAAKISRLARDRRVSKSAIVREAIANLAETAPATALEAFGSAVGAVDGPPDLSTNPRYLDGLGE